MRSLTLGVTTMSPICDAAYTEHTLVASLSIVCSTLSQRAELAAEGRTEVVKGS